ncbi:MAG: hypothetical protein K5657_09400 [Desulfovibrio sp.]|nr:hypothetical protein [Desulfovibrio sp.]
MRKISLFLLMLSFMLASTFSPTFAADPENVVWRFAEKHEYGDLEPSDFCYICIHNDTLLMHWISPGELETITVYTITQKNGKRIEARKTLTYTPDAKDEKTFLPTSDKELTEGHTTISFTISGNTLAIDNWISLKKEEADIRRAFPEIILKKHFKCNFTN